MESVGFSQSGLCVVCVRVSDPCDRIRLTELDGLHVVLIKKHIHRGYSVSLCVTFGWIE